jgi:hypothetical protein
VRALVVLASLLALAACQPEHAPGPPAASSALVLTPEPGDLPGLHHVSLVLEAPSTGGPLIVTGGEPEGEEGLATLAALGIRTVISVDGMRPDVEAARRHGLRYVHLPIGYDGIPARRTRAIQRAVRDLPGPFYVHCHHGRHRGPAAAAIALRVLAPHADPLAVLERSGTSPDYVGLWRDVRGYAPGPLDAGVSLPEVAETSDMVQAMASVDRRFDRVSACADAGWSSPEDHPDLDPPHEALLLAEALRESARLASASDAPYAPGLEAAADEAWLLRAALEELDVEAMDARLAGLRGRCTACHTAHRN